MLLVIEEANWLDLADNHGNVEFPEGGFDAVICLGNSFAHLPDLTGDQENHRIAIRNFHKVLKPGGLLFIDHRNYDAILDSGKAPHRNVYYNVRSCIKYSGENRTVVNHRTSVAVLSSVISALSAFYSA